MKRVFMIFLVLVCATGAVPGCYGWYGPPYWEGRHGADWDEWHHWHEHEHRWHDGEDGRREGEREGRHEK